MTPFKVGDNVQFEGVVESIVGDTAWITAKENNPEAAVEPIAVRFLTFIPPALLAAPVQEDVVDEMLKAILVAVERDKQGISISAPKVLAALAAAGLEVRKVGE